MKIIIDKWDLESKNGENPSRMYQLLVKRAELVFMHGSTNAVHEESSQSTSSSYSDIKRAFDCGCDHSPPLTPALK